jgi:hypothetical protein
MGKDPSRLPVGSHPESCIAVCASVVLNRKMAGCMKCNRLPGHVTALGRSLVIPGNMSGAVDSPCDSDKQPTCSNNSSHEVRTVHQPGNPALRASAQPDETNLSLEARNTLGAEKSSGRVPDFLIIGAQRCGTTSLYNYLLKHPRVSGPRRKELHFFDLHFHKGMEWYRRQFGRHGAQWVTGEASPYYIFHPHAARRVADSVPWTRLIVLLRNPVDRAYSHYWHEVRLRREPLSFEDALHAEQARLHGELDKMISNENYNSFNYREYSYVSRSTYIDQIRTWMSLFDASQMLIIKSEDLYEDTEATYRTVTDFLGIQAFIPNKTEYFMARLHQAVSRIRLPEYIRHKSLWSNRGIYPAMSPVTRDTLYAYFRPYNGILYEYLGRDFGWDLGTS